MSAVGASKAMLPFNPYSRLAAAHRSFLCFPMSRVMRYVLLLGPVHRGLGLVISRSNLRYDGPGQCCGASMIYSRHDL